MPTKRTLTRQLQDARAQIRDLVEKRDEAAGAAGTEHFNVVRLVKQVNEARDEIDELRRQLNALPKTPSPDAWKTERARLRQRLELAERARISLDAQLMTLTLANDAMSREAYDRAVAVEVAR